MKKHNLKKSFALSVLMAFVITGGAYAENVNVSEGKTKDDQPTILVNSGETFNNAGTVNAGESITIYNGQFQNSGTIETGSLNIYGSTNDQEPISGKITAGKEFVYNGIGGDKFWRKLSAQIITPKLHIIGKNTNQTGLEILNNNVLQNVGEIAVESQGGKTGLIIGGTEAITVKAPIYLKTTAGRQDARVEVDSGETFTANEIISEKGKTKVQLNHSSSATLNNIRVENGGNFSLQTWTKEHNLSDKNEPKDTATFTLKEITVGDNAAFKTSIYENQNGTINCSTAKITGKDVTINLGKSSKADFGGVGDGDKKDWRGDLIDFQVDKLTINVSNTDEYKYANIGDYKKDYENGVYIHVNDKYNPLDDTIGCGRINVIGAGTTNTGNLENDLQRLAYVVKITQEIEDQEYENLPKILAPIGARIKQEPGEIDDGGSGTIDDDGKVTDVEIIKNPDVYGVEEVGALGLLSWRTELSDMNKRLGELRDSDGEHGVWVRMVRGENDYKSLNSQYNIYQLGYDEKLSVDPNWTVGAAFSYTDGNGGYDTGNFEMDHKTLTLYGSKLNDDGSYIDIVGKYSRLNHDLMNTWGDGEYDANGYSVGVEVGKRFTQDNGFWIEPQAQLTYGHVGSANYRAGDIEVAQDGMESLIGRAGVRIGKDLNNGNVYLRASYLYDFDGETSVTFTNAKGRERSFEQDLGGGWCEVGLGTNINLSDATHLYFDVEKTFGGDVATDWKWNAGMRWDF